MGVLHMSELLSFAPVVVVAFIIGILIGMGLQVRSEMRWMGKIEQEQTEGTEADGR